MRVGRFGITIALVLPGAARADWPVGVDIWPAIYVDVTPEGFASTEAIAGSLLPTTYPIDPSLIDQEGEIDLLLIGSDYSFSVENLYLSPVLNDLSIVPDTDVLHVSMNLGLAVNSAADPAILHVNANLSLLGFIEFEVIDEDCSMYVNSFNTTLDADVKLVTLRDRYGMPILDPGGHLQIDTEFEDITYVIPPLEQEDLHLGSAPGGSCIIDDIADIADFLGLDVVELVIAEVTPTLDAQIVELTEELEATVESTFSSLVIEETVDLLGTPLAVGVEPKDIYVSPDGLRLEMTGSFDAGELPHPCVSRFIIEDQSRQTIPSHDPRYPYLGQIPPTATSGMSVMVNDDWLNQAAYATWRSGLLCLEVSDVSSPVELPLPINTSLLSILAPGGFDQLFPTPAPLVLKTRPEQPPIVHTGGAHSLDITIDTLGLDFMGELDGRLARLAGLDLAATIGIDASFNPTTGELGADVDFDPSLIVAKVSFNDLNPSANEQMELNFSSLADTLVGSLLGDALTGLVFPLPSFAGLGLTSAAIDAVGAPNPADSAWLPDFIGVFGTVGLVDYGDPTGGCESSDLGGDLTSGCTDGSTCSTGGGRALPLTFLLLLALRRRR